MAEVLACAGDVLELVGWCQRRSVSRDGQRCAAGAIRFAVRGAGKSSPMDFSVDREALIEDSMSALRRHTGERSIVYWNDAPGRQAFEVIGAMRVAAKALT